MDQNDDRKKTFLAELEEQIKDQYRQYRIQAWVQTSLMILIALAGFLTGAAGLDNLHSFWYSQPNALLAWGGITALGAAFNQFSDPGRSSQRHLMTKIALKSIRGAVLYQGLSVNEADKLRNRAWKDPERVAEDMGQLQIAS
ncbi:MAG TPA: hypothetical protein VK249_13850 [Anaerolineales bacterium]|nr:hypothetical protein [Anaerolineales bacterium]